MLSTAVATSYNLVRDEPYQPSTIAPISNDPRTSWCMLYDMKQDYAAGKAYYIPSWFGDIGLVAYPHIYRHSVFTKVYVFFNILFALFNRLVSFPKIRNIGSPLFTLSPILFMNSIPAV